MDNKQIVSVSEMNFSNICLLCHENEDNLLEIYGKQGIVLKIGATLQEHFWFEVTAFDERSICGKCWEKVESFNTFYNFVKYIHQQQSICEPKPIVDSHYEHIELLEVKVEPNIDIKDDFDDSADGTDIIDSHGARCDTLEVDKRIDSCNSTQRAQKSKRKTVSSSTETTLKKFKTDSHLNLLSQYFNMTCDLCDTSISFRTYRDAKKHYKHVHDVEKGYLICCSKKFYRLQHMLQHCEWHVNPDSFKCAHCPKNFSDKYRLRDHLNHCHAPENDKIFNCGDCDKTFSKKHYLSAHLRKGHNTKPLEEKPIRKSRRTYDREHEMIRNRFLMQCDLCSEPYSMFRDAQLHHLKEHNQAGYLYCCDRKFFKMYKAVQHCIWHEDPESFKCTFCQKCFTDKIGLRDHVRNVHSPEDERQYQCDICKKSFAKSYILRSHMKVNHIKDEDKKFECHICGIRFVIESFLKSHIDRVHRNVHTHMCELCAKPFKSGKSYEMHYINFHTNISQKVQCEICGKWLKHKDSLKKHILWHNSTTATCGVCGRVSSNIRALRAHMRSAHRVASLECTVCGKMFKKPQVLKEHMAIHAGITDLYTCTFCTKTFRSNANMYSHRKRAHPVELEQKKAEVPPGH